MEIKKKEIEQKRKITQYYLKCQECGKEIRGYSESQLLYCLKIHKEYKHKGKKRDK